MTINRIGPMSLAKISGALYALLGLIGGAVISLVAVVGGAMGGSDAGMMGMLFGVGAVILLPICYGALGFLTSLVAAAIYNMVAGWVGGLEIEAK